jgi:hypothetical protein
MEVQVIQTKIFKIRGQMVILDFDLAALYKVETKVLNQAVRRNIERFPEDFMFQLSRDEYTALRSQFVTLEKGRGKYSKYNPFAFTEHGVAMLSGILNSQKAIETNIAIMRAFVALRRYAMTFDELAAKIISHDKELADINEVLRWLGEENQARADEIKTLRQPADHENPDDWQNRPRIGFKK